MLLLLLLASLLGMRTALAREFNLGDLEQYNSKTDGPAQLDGHSIWISGTESEGFDIRLAPETENKIREALEKCDERINNDCYQRVHGILRSADLEIDQSLQKRGFAQLLSKTFKKLRGVFFTITAIVLAVWEQRKATQPELNIAQYHVPESQASAGAAFGSETPVTVSGHSSVIVTVTPTPDPTTLVGSNEPTVVPVTASSGNLRPGDLNAKLDADLASKVNEVMHRQKDCEDGQLFVDDIARKKMLAYVQNNPVVGNLGHAVCAAEGAATMAQPGGPLSDLLLLEPYPFLFKRGDFQDAARVVEEFVRAYAPLLTIDEEAATDLALFLFALALDTIVDNLVLGTNNPIRASRLEADITRPTTTASCAVPSSCVATCDGVGDNFYVCETSCAPLSTTICATGSATKTILSTITNMWDMPTAAAEAPMPPAQPLAPDCDGGMERTSFPANLFHGNDGSVVEKFCKTVTKKPDIRHGWDVDSKGDRTGARVPRAAAKRAPPSRPDQFESSVIHLVWEPKKDFDKSSCPMSCVEAYDSIAKGSRGRNGGTADMAVKGSRNIGCGTYRWEIIEDYKPPITPLEKGKNSCNDRTDDAPSPNKQDLLRKITDACRDMPRFFDPDTHKWKKAHKLQGIEWNLSVEWMPGCKTTVEEQDAHWPLGASRMDKYQEDCISAFFSPVFCPDKNADGKNTNGGSINIGCLRYSTYPSRR